MTIGRVLDADTIFYRVSGGEAGRVARFMTRTRPANVKEAIEKLALDRGWGNEAVFLEEVHVPKGTVIWEGIAAKQGALSGGGSQVWISKEQLSERWFQYINW